MRRFLRPIPLAITAVTLLLLYTLIGFFLIPHLIKAHVFPAVAERLQRPVSAKEVEFNPFVLSLRMTEFEIQEKDQTPLIGFQEFFINFQTSSLFRRAYVFDEIRFIVPYASVKVGRDGHVNLSQLGAPKEPEAASSEAAPVHTPSQAPAELPAVEIGYFEIAQGIVEFRDASKPHVVSIDVVPINLVLKNFFTRPGGDNRYSFVAELGKDEILDWNGTVSLEPIASEGTLSLSGVKIATVFQYVRDQFRFDIPIGYIQAEGRYRFAAGAPLDLEISDALLHLTNVGIVEKGEPVPVIALDTLYVDGIHADLRQRKLEIESATLNKGAERLWRNPDGSINLATLFLPAEASPGKEEAAPPGKGPAWTVSIKEAQVAHHDIQFEDRSLSFPARTKISKLAVRTHDVMFPFRKPIPVTLETHLNDTGTLSVDGQVIVQPLTADVTMVLKDIAIQPFEPYVESFARIAVDSGTIDLDGKLHFASDHPKGPLIDFHGNLGVKSLAVADRDEGHPVASWKQVQLSNLALTLDPTSVTIDELGIVQPTVHVTIDRDGISSIKKLLPPATPAEASPVSARPAARIKKTPPPSLAIHTVKVLRGTATFEDDSISPAVKTGLYDLTGTVKGLSSKQIARADVDLSGKIDKVAPLKIAGTINPLTEDAFSDLTIRFDNVDLTTATPYTGKYVGYPIRKGKLFLDLVYKVSEKQVEAENKVAVDQLTFGDKTDSPDALSLPVLLAVALLKDRNGRIDIDLPIRGNLKDPDFKYGKVVLSTLGNLLAKIAASPFTLIGKLVPGGGDAEELQHLTFDPGSADIPPAEMKKLDALLKGLEERPGLRLEITGTADPARDRRAVALQRFQEVVRNRWRQENKGTSQTDLPPEVEGQMIAQLFEQWRKDQPQALQPPDAKPLTTEEMKRTLVESIKVDDDALRALARTRAEQVQAQMVGDGKLPEERVFLTDVDLTASDHDKVQSRLNISAGS